MSLDLTGDRRELGPDPRRRHRLYGGEKPRHLWSSAGSAGLAFQVSERAALMAQGGEFAFVLYAAATTAWASSTVRPTQS